MKPVVDHCTVPEEATKLTAVFAGKREEWVFGQEEAPQGHWSQYFDVTWKRLRRDFGWAPTIKQTHSSRGTIKHVFFASDLPKAAGLSSSSVFIVNTI